MAPHTPATHPARSVLEKFNRDHPNIWRLVDNARKRGRAAWAKEVFLPLPAAQGLLLDRYPRRYWNPDALDKDGMRLSMLAAWRTTQGIYRFDPDLYDELIASSFDKELPLDALSRLPEWCVYIETPGRKLLLDGNPVEQLGLWAWLDCLNDTPEPSHLAVASHLVPNSIVVGHLPLAVKVQKGLAEIYKDNYGDASSSVPGGADSAFNVLAPCLSLLFHLCSEAPEVGDGQRVPHRPQPRYTKGREVTSPAAAPVKWDVGVRIGEVLRRWKERQSTDSADAAAGPRTLRPHVRIGHWAHRWVGPMNGERKSVLVWIHPALVNAKSPEEIPAVIRPVKKAG